MPFILSRRKYWLTLATLMLLLLGALVIVQYVLWPAETPKYLTAPAKFIDIEESVLANGIVQPAQQINVGAQVNGQLKKLHVVLGQRVKKGELLAEIDPVLQKNALDIANAELAALRAEKTAKQALLKEHEFALQRQQLMFAEEASARAELEHATAQCAAARAHIQALSAQITKAQITVDSARANLGYTRITAPIDGEVIAIITKEGQTVVSTQSAPTLLILANIDKMLVRAQISEADVMRTRVGQPVYFTILGLPDKPFHSQLGAIEPAPESISADTNNITSTSPNSTNHKAVYYNGLFEITNTERLLKPLMTAQVTIVQRKVQRVLAIPSTAVSKSAQGTEYVRCLKNGKVEQRTVRVGLNNGVYVQVMHGLVAGDQVIIDDSTTPQPEGLQGE